MMVLSKQSPSNRLVGFLVCLYVTQLSTSRFDRNGGSLPFAQAFSTRVSQPRHSSFSPTSQEGGPRISSPWESPLGLEAMTPLRSTRTSKSTRLLQSSYARDSISSTGSSALKRPLWQVQQFISNLRTSSLKDVPSYRKMMIFAGTTVLIWLSEPLLSLVDTTVVGWSQGSTSVVQLASLGPATTLMDTLLYMTYFLALSTTNLLTQGLAERDWRSLQKWTSHLLAVALLVGGGVSLLVATLGPSLLSALAGSAATPELVQYALQYSRIRAAVAPAAVVGMVAQSFCLANLQSRAPLLAVATASLVNIVGDLALSRQGVVGAATATAFATLASAGILVRAVQKTLHQWRQEEINDWRTAQDQAAAHEELVSAVTPSVTVTTTTTASSSELDNTPMEDALLAEVNDSSEPVVSTTTIMEATTSTDSSTDEVVAEQETTLEQQEMTSLEATSTEVAAPSTPSGPPKQIPFLSLPSRQSLWKLATISGPLCFNMWAKMGSYAALTVRATRFGVAPLAAHNVLMRLFFFFGCFADAMGLCAQAFLPPCLYPVANPASYEATMARLKALAVSTSVFLAQGATLLLAWAGPFLARDSVMRKAMMDQSPWLALSLFLHPLVVSMEGTVIATRQMGALLRTYGVALVLHGITLSTTTSFNGIWQALALFQGVRFLNYQLWSRNGIRATTDQSSVASAVAAEAPSATVSL